VLIEEGVQLPDIPSLETVGKTTDAVWLQTVVGKLANVGVT
jgi:hypothetical protein